MPIIRRSDCVPLPTIVCPVVAVVMLEIRVARCVHCLKAGNILHTLHTSFYPTLQHHNSYNRTDNYRQWNAVGFPDDGHKDARNMLRYYRLPINHYLLHLVDLTFTYLIKMCLNETYSRGWVRIYASDMFHTKKGFEIRRCFIAIAFQLFLRVCH